MQNMSAVKKIELYDWPEGKFHSALIEARRIGKDYLLAMVLG